MRLTTEIDNLLLSSEVPTICVETSADRIEATLLKYGAEVYKATLFSIDGRVEIHDLRSVIEETLEDYDESHSDWLLRFQANGETSLEVSFATIYCSKRSSVSAETIARAMFLTTVSAKRTFKTARERLSYLAMSGEVITAQYRVVVRYGAEQRAIDFSGPSATAASTDVRTLSADYNTIAAMLAAQSLTEQPDEIVGWTVRVGERVMTYYLEAGEPDWQVEFRNMFNALDFANLRCVTTSKVDTSKSETVSARTTIYYDCKSIKSHEVETGPLGIEEALWLEQLVESPKVFDSAGHRLLISGYDSSHSDDDNEVSHFKITWRYAEDRGWASTTEPGAGIFNDKYDYTFS